MPWIKSTYTYEKAVTGENETVPIYINLDQVRAIRRTPNGWARILWAARVDAIILGETYEEFIIRVRNLTGPEAG